MLTLQKVTSLVRDRLAEESDSFWSDSNLRDYVNSAQSFLSVLTRGVRKDLTGTVDRDTSTVALPGSLMNAHADGGFVDGGDSLITLSVADANLISPSWRRWKDVRPKWLVLDIPQLKAHVVPIPLRAVDVTVTVSVYPDDVVGASDELFDGVAEMRRYQEPLVNMAVCFALLKERYDGDAERFYQFATGQLTDMGIAPTLIPSFEQAVSQNG